MVPGPCYLDTMLVKIKNITTTKSFIELETLSSLIKHHGS
jgi:hypothetical protein